MKNILNLSDRHIAILDVEASALEAGSYPIEVGVALVRGPSEPIGVGAKLIRPTKKWLDTGVWSKSSEAVHGMPPDLVKREGKSVDEVCDWLNGLLGTDTIVATDAPRYDQDWLDTLFAAADHEQNFKVLDFQVLTRDFSADQHRHLAYLLRKDAPPHRAAEDALRLASKLMETHWGHPPRESHLPAFSDFGGESK
ncbi:hypothetical protein K3152_13075 [Qipengyuania sp. 1NDH17]|uniref:Exonuclease domain-containing protein n=1 Tax=Qipengyuania polymorpha TaxID=2867234 RepID=A0ABS7J033_9SPHN|nr:hypothetical protein [Qipengyuania polymorpha]MBX7459184.1 hypothetical protein [Qipengyuania polymorpha]